MIAGRISRPRPDRQNVRRRHWDVTPIVHLGKALGGGILPVWRWSPTATFSGTHPGIARFHVRRAIQLAAAVGHTVVDMLADGTWRRGPPTMAYTSPARGYVNSSGHGVFAVRGKGPWAGIDIDPDARHR